MTSGGTFALVDPTDSALDTVGSWDFYDTIVGTSSARNMGGVASASSERYLGTMSSSSTAVVTAGGHSHTLGNAALNTSAANPPFQVVNYAIKVDSPPEQPALSSPTNAALLATSPTLQALHTDENAGDSSALTFEVCSDAACATVVQTTDVLSIASGGTASWAPVILPSGLYYWRARATDAWNEQSVWSSIRSFRVDAMPGAPTLISPTDGE